MTREESEILKGLARRGGGPETLNALGMTSSVLTNTPKARRAAAAAALEAAGLVERGTVIDPRPWVLPRPGYRLTAAGLAAAGGRHAC